MENELYHWRTRGSKNGVRQYQNEDGSYKPGAEGRYDPEPTGYRKKSKKDDDEPSYHNPKHEQLAKLRAENERTAAETERLKSERNSYNKEPIESSQNDRKRSGYEFVKKAAIATAAVASIGAAAYLGKKYLTKETISKVSSNVKSASKNIATDAVKDSVTKQISTPPVSEPKVKKTRTVSAKSSESGKSYVDSVSFDTIRAGANKKTGNDWYKDYIAYVAMNTSLRL